METLYLLIPLSFVLLLVICLALWWAINDGQYEDLKGPADRVVEEPDFIHDGAAGSPRTAATGQNGGSGG